MSGGGKTIGEGERVAIDAATIRAPFGNYSHAVLVPPGARMLFCSGQLGVRADDTTPETVAAQAEVCFDNIGALLREAGMGFGDIVRLAGFVTRREDMAAYMAVRDRYVATPPPASTLVIVSGFTRPEFLVEVEAVAAA